MTIRKLIFFILFIFIQFNFYASSFKISIGGTGNEYGTHMIETADKGFLLVGYTTGGTAVGEDGLVVKIDKNGTVQWSKTFSNTGNERFNGCIELNSNYYLVGQTTTATIGGQDAWCVKIDTLGNLIWSKKYGTTAADGFHKLKALSNDRIMLCGYSGGSGGEQLAYLYAVKIDVNGTTLFERSYGSGLGTTKTNVARNLALTSTGDILLLGYTYCFGAGLHDGIVVSIDTTAGNRLWTKSYGGSGNDVMHSIMNDKNGNLIGSGYDRLNGSVDTRFWVLNLDNQGNNLWQKSYYHNTTSVNYIGAISTAEDKGFISTINASAPSGSLSTEIMRIDSVGNTLWIRKFDDSNIENLSTILTTSDTNYIALGYTNSFGNGGYDMFIVKLDRFGSIDNCCVKSSTILVQSAGMVVSPQVQVDKSNVSNTTNTPIGVSVSLQKIISCSPTVSNVSINASFCSGNTYTLPSGAVVSSAGTYVSNLVNAAGCDSIVTVTLSVNNAISTTINSGICPGSSYVLPDGIVVSNPGTYTTILNAANGCDSTIISNLSFQTTVTIAENVVLCSGDKYLLPGGDLIFDAGIYTDTVLTAFGCDSIIITTVAIEPLNGVFAEVPNVFTPNDDGKNDFFVVGNSGYCVESYSILVYNRWGQKVFESTNIDESWDGRISGNIAAAGTYFYIIVSKNNNNSENKKTGFVTVIR